MNKEWYFVIATAIWSLIFPVLIFLEKITKGNTLLWNYSTYKNSPTGNATPSFFLLIIIMIFGAISLISISKYYKTTK